jgi:hypothetical protein
MTQPYGNKTKARIAEVVRTCRAYGASSIIALAGVPGTGKSYVARAAAQQLATTVEMVAEVQFHPSYSYEEFIEGFRPNRAGGFGIQHGIFLEWNYQSINDPGKTYVLLIEELTRANLPAVLGELLTYVEYRDDAFRTLYSRKLVKVSKELIILATYNPLDRSALELDNAILRRLRVILFPPDIEQLGEMEAANSLPRHVVRKLTRIFTACKENYGHDYPSLMPFGHGIFSEVRNEVPDLFNLWHQRIEHMLKPPGRSPHTFWPTISANYPWKASDTYKEPDPTAAPIDPPAAGSPSGEGG